MTKKNKYGNELIKIEMEVSKKWHDHVLNWTKKHRLGYDRFEEILQSLAQRYMEDENKRRKELLDDFSKGFIKGYAMGCKNIPDTETIDSAKWIIPYTLTAEALTQMALMQRELS